MKTSARALAFALVIIPLCGLHADYEGADSVLKQVAEGRASAKPANNGDTPEKLAADLAAFAKTAATLPPEKAAAGWLELADRYAAIPPGNYGGSMVRPQPLFGFDQVVAAVPPPAAWPALAKAIESRDTKGGEAAAYRAIVLRLISHRLVGDNDALNKDIDLLRGNLKKAMEKMQGYVPGYPDSIADQLKGQLLQDSDNGEAILKQLETNLGQPATPGEPNQIQVPDLVTLAGKEKAADFLRRALRSYVVLNIDENGGETIKLARKLALDMAAELKSAQWALADSIDSTALFEAMSKRFPDAKGRAGGDFAEARTYYLLGLIAAHRTKEAAALATNTGKIASGYDSVPSEGIDALERAGLTTELADFFYEMLSKNPDLRFWDAYVDVTVRAGQQKKMLALIEAAAARPDLNDARRAAIMENLREAYLATDRVDDGIAILRKEIAAAKEAATKTPPAAMNPNAPRLAGPSQLQDLGLSLANIGAVLERKELVDEGLKTTLDSLKANPNESEVESAAMLLIALDRGPEAEAVLKDALIALPLYRGNDAQLLSLLMCVYDRANRSADVLALLDHAQGWSQKDLSGLLSQSVTIDRNEDYVAYFAAKALAAGGRNADARKILDALMDEEAGYDPAYELLIKIAPRDEALARLDELFARDKFEPRPLIWKAKVLLDAGKLEDAEAAARQAVTIDPSDGEHGPGRRMRVYAVLADIRAARGDSKEAELYRGAVTAIRHSENADRFYETGLITRAIQMYQESLTHFADAYCIQSRLALRMAEIGDMAGAEEHYRRAYELMPDSFGRVESHCFGCERAFAGYYAQSIAEKVFTDLAKKRPEKPQVHYLLGYLRMEEGNDAGALTEFREAVRLDPEYLNAWNKISEIGGRMRLSAAENESVELNLLRLDPLQRHSRFDASKIRDLAAAWNALEAASKLAPTKPAALYPLQASAAELVKQYGAQPPQPSEGTQAQNPGAVISQNQFMETVSQIYSIGGMAEMEAASEMVEPGE